MDRTKHIELADAAMVKAERLAGDAERYAHSPESSWKTGTLAAAGALWTEVAKAHAAIAQALPADEQED